MQTPISQTQPQQPQPDQPIVQLGEQQFIYHQPQSIPQAIAPPDPAISWKPLYLVFAGAVICGCLLWLQQVGQRRTVEAHTPLQPTPTIQPPTAQPSPSIPLQSASNPVKTPQPQPEPQATPVPTPQAPVSFPAMTPNGITVCPNGSGTCRVRLRAAPGLGSAVYTALPSDVPVQRIGPVQMDNQGIAWTYVNVDYNGQMYTGWIASNLLHRW
jgi:hypothetical protein